MFYCKNLTAVFREYCNLFSFVNRQLSAINSFAAFSSVSASDSKSRSPKTLQLLALCTTTALLLLVASSVRAADDYVWWEGESPATSNFPSGSWLSPGNDFERNQLSGANILTAGDRNQPYYAQYNVTVSAAGTYKLYTRRFWSYGAFKWRFDSGEWRFASTDLQRMDSADYKTYFPLNWIYLGEISLSAGAHTFRIEVNQADWTNENDRNSVDKFGADAFILSQQAFVPRGKLKPDEKYNLREPGWWNFEPARDRFTPNALLDLSYLNEDVAGQNGFVRRQGDKFVLGDGSPARFWAVTTSNIGSDLASMRQQAKFMAKRGVNLVRFHTTVAASDRNNINAVNQAAVDGAHRMVAAFKQEGIYTKLSNFFVLGLTVRKEWGVDGYTEDKHAPFSILMFDPKLKAAYKEWMRQMMTSVNPHTGVSLANDPSVAIIEIQNEDNFFFWTFNPDVFPEAQRQRIDNLFGSYLANKYGSIQNAMNAWGQSAPQWRDAPNQGRMTVQGAWFMTPAYTGDPKRMADQIQFLTELQRNFYVEMRDYFRNSLGSQSLLEASNWTTADERTLQDIERYTYTATDVIDKHHYFGGAHTDPNGENSSGYAVNEGDYFQSLAVVKNPRALPAGYKQVAGFPNIISESTWTNPNRYKAEGPLLVAAYSSMADIDGFIWFASGALAYEDDVNKFPTSVPSLIGQFPGAALLYRRGDVTETNAVRDERNLQKMYAKELSLISESAKYDPNRNNPSDPPYDPNTGVGQIDTLAMLVGKVEGNYTNSDVPDYIAPNLLSRIDLTTKNVRSLPTASRANGELRLDWNRGLFRVDTPRSQGVTGFLSTDSNVNLTDVAIASTNEFGAVLVIALDNKPIRESNKILIQAMTEDAPYGWREVDQTFALDGVTYNGKRIAAKGQAPMNVREIAATVTLKGLGQGVAPTITVLDENGYARNAGSGTIVGEDFRITLPTDALYTVVTRSIAPPSGNGTGLRGEYFDNADLTNLVTTRTDANVDFDYGSGTPAGTAITSSDTFSVRWSGQVEAPVAGNYTFTTTSDDGVRLFINDQLIINNWTLHAPTDDSATIQLAAGRHNIRMEFYENTGGAVARLSWAYPGQARQIVPQTRLYPSNTTPPNEWILCANEGQQCAFTSTKEVRYGASGQYAFRTLTDGTACTNNVFGDPIVGTTKQCWYRTPGVNNSALTRVRFVPRSGYAGRMIGGKFTGSNTSPTNDFATLYTITASPQEGAWNEVAFPNDVSYRFIKFEAPNDAYGNIAELEFYSGNTRLTGTGFGTSGSWNNSGNDFTKAFDGDINTFFDAPFGNGTYVGIDRGASSQASAPTFSPSPGAYPSAQNVTISTATAGATIRYTTNGSIPTATSGNVYTAPIAVSTTTTISAIAYKDGLASSVVTIGTFTIGVTPPPTASQKTYHFGNSLTDPQAWWLTPIAQSAGYNNHVTLRSTTPGAPIDWLWNHGAVFGEIDFRVAFQNHAPIDHLFLQTPFAGHPRSTDNEATYATNFYQLAQQRSPNIQLWVYAQWPDKNFNDYMSKGETWPFIGQAPSGLSRATTYEQACLNFMYYHEDVRQETDNRNGGKSVLVIPGPLAMRALKIEIDAGRVPGLTDFFAANFSDDLHLNSRGQYLINLVHFAAIYKRSPEGIVTSANTGLTAEQAAIYQKIAWNTVRNYQWSGVSAN